MSSTISAASTAANTAISSTGIGSGLDINSIVTSLTKAAGLAQNTQLSDRQSTLTSEISAYGTFSSALSTLQATLTTLKTSAALAGRTATLGDTTIATGTATANAIPAQYSLTVQNLATAASLSSKAFANENAAVGTGALTIAIGGNSTSINIDSTNNTLAGIVSAVNGAVNNPGITASILTTSAGARLVLSGTVTGTANSIKVTQSGGNGALSALVYDPANATTNLTQTQAAQDANFTVNGFAASSASNQVTSVISGVTLNLLKTTAVGTPTTLIVGTDSAGTQTSIGTFVTALNGLMTSIHKLTSYDPSTQTAGPLLGNATVQSFQNQLHTILDQVQAGNTGAATSLASLGITANPQGTYDKNSTTLGNTITANLSSVTGFFGGIHGLANQLDGLITQYTQTGGLLDSINQGLKAGLTDIAKQQTALDARLKTYAATLTKEYNAMDTAVGLLKQTQTYLTAEFNPNSGTSGSANTSLSSGNLKTGG